MTLLEFAIAMETKLRANAHKGGWQNCTMAYLTRRLGQEAGELRRAIARNAPSKEVVAEAADVANFAMMIADVYRPRVKP